MKQKDLVLVIAIIGGAALLSFLVFSVVFGKKTNAKMKVEVVEPISSDFKLPSTKYFNKDSLNPTQTITIAPDANQNPFGQ